MLEARLLGRPTLTLTFEDPVYHLVVSLRFEVFPEHDVIRRTTDSRTPATAPVRVERVLSGALGLPRTSYDAWTLHGQWGGGSQLTSPARAGQVRDREPARLQQPRGESLVRRSPRPARPTRSTAESGSGRWPGAATG